MPPPNTPQASSADLPVLLLGGGYKAYRHWVLELFERPWPLRLLGGRTGCGKTDLLLALRQRGVAVLDLEGQPLRYNTRNEVLNPWFVASGDPGRNWLALLHD